MLLARQHECARLTSSVRSEESETRRSTVQCG
jgi:hypothetical protein